MARAIQFHAPNAPNFGEANDLTLKSMELGNHAVKSITDTWNNAVKAVENRNHAEMKQMIDAYNHQQLQDPTVLNQVQEDIKRLGLETGNVYDPVVMQTYLDTRGDTLLKRNENNLDYDVKEFKHDNEVLNDRLNKAFTISKYLEGRYRTGDTPENIQHNAWVNSELSNLVEQFPKEQQLLASAFMNNKIREQQAEDARKVLADSKVRSEIGVNNANAFNTSVKASATKTLLPYEVLDKQSGIAYRNAQTLTENALRQGKVDEQDIRNIGNLYKNQAEQDKPSEQITNIQKGFEKYGFPSQAIDKDGNLNVNMLRNSITTSVGIAKDKAGNQFDMSYIDWANKHKPDLIKVSKIHPTKLNDFALFLNEQHEKNGLALTDRQKIILETALIDGTLPIERILNGNFLGMSNYGSAIEELGKKYLKQNEAIDEQRKTEVAKNTLMTKITELSSVTGLSPIDMVERGIIPNEYLILLPDNFLPETMREAIAKKKEESKKTAEQRLIEESNRYKTISQNNKVKESDEITGGTYGW